MSDIALREAQEDPLRKGDQMEDSLRVKED